MAGFTLTETGPPLITPVQFMSLTTVSVYTVLAIGLTGSVCPLIISFRTIGLPGLLESVTVTSKGPFPASENKRLVEPPAQIVALPAMDPSAVQIQLGDTPQTLASPQIPVSEIVKQ
jgi:hypothetical protein